MVKANVVIKNASGLHLRPTGVLCNEAIRYQSSVKFQSGNTLTNAKSVLSVLGEGPDEEEALAAMIRIIEDGLGE